MGNFNLNVDVKGKKVGDRIKDRIEDGISSASEDLQDGIRREAKERIRNEKAIFRGELLNGFAGAKTKFGDSTVVSVRNLAPHASYQEHGVSGTEKKRDTPHAYTDKKPPIEALIPWVRQNLAGYNFDDDDDGFSVSGGSDDGSGPDDSGGADINSDPYKNYRQNHEPTMGADGLSVGDEIGFQHQRYGFINGTIDKVFENYRDRYQVKATINGSEGFVGANPEDITDFPGRGIDPVDLEVGLLVYIGQPFDKFGTVTKILKDPETGKINGAEIDLTGDGKMDDVFDLRQFEVAKKGSYENGVPLDENRLYQEETRYTAVDQNSAFDIQNTFPGQDVVVYDRDFDEYSRATVKSYDPNDNTEITIEAQDGSEYNLYSTNNHIFRLVGYENWDTLSESDQKQRLRDYFNNVLSNSYNNWLTKQERDNYGFADPDSSVIESAKDFFTNDLFDLYNDTEYVKNIVSGLQAIVSYDNSVIKSRPSLGGSILDLDENYRHVGAFLTDHHFDTLSKWDKDDRPMILFHEGEHALSSAYGFGRTSSVSHDSQDMLMYADWRADGSSGGLTSLHDIPNHADELLFRTPEGVREVIGGTSWITDAYYAADRGVPGIKSYSPNYQTGTDEPVKRLHEAANHAWWIQQVAGNKHYLDQGFINEDLYIRKYSTKNPAETLATLNEQMTGTYDDWEDILEVLVNLYPWFIEAWLEVHNPPKKVENKLIDLGYTI